MEKNKLEINTKVVAEIANSHQGNIQNAIKLANECVKAGADAIKFQVYTANELLHKKHKRFDHFKNQSFNSSEWNLIFSKVKKNKTKIFCDVFGEDSFNICNNNIKVDGFKIHSSDLINENLLNLVSSSKKKFFFLSTGGSTLREISYAVSFFKRKNIKPILMHGYQNYPTKISDTNLRRILNFQNIFSSYCRYGLQDHISGDDEMSFAIPFASMSMGLDFIEKHVTLDRSKKGVDYYSALEPEKLKDFVNKINLIKRSYGDRIYDFSESEKKYRREVKKIWFLNKNLKKNKSIDKRELTMKRPPQSGISSMFAENFKKLVLNKNVQREKALINFDLKNVVTAVIVVRLKSKRLPNKALKKINDRSLIEHLISRLKISKKINKIVLATTKNKEDLKFKKIAKKNKIDFYCGEEKNVLKRMLNAAKKFKSSMVIRVTGDDILIDPQYLDRLVEYHLKNNLEYSNNKKLPGGTEVEIFNFELLSFLQKVIQNPNDTEYLTFFIDKYKDQFNTGSLNIPLRHQNKQSMTIDTNADFLFVKKFFSKFKNNDYKIDDVIDFLKKNKKKTIPAKIDRINVNTDFEWKNILK